MVSGQEYYKFKAEVWRNFGYALCSAIGIIFMNFILNGYAMNKDLTIVFITGMVLFIFGLILIYHSLDIMERTYGTIITN
jgi:putative Ca2+/H+ antiporter (TMEM165/GDT1 family)